MALTLTGSIPTIFAATQKVSRELIGLIPVVTRNAKAERAAVGQTIASTVSPARAARNTTIAATLPSLSDVTYGAANFTITKSREVPVEWSGEEQMSVDADGRPYNVILANDMAQSMRTLANEIEADIAGLYSSASRATGTSGTAPYASTLGDAAALEKILDDNGAPPVPRYALINSNAVVNLRARATLNDPDRDVQDFVQRGSMINLAGISHRKTHAIKTHTKGTGAGYLVDLGGGYAAGTTTIHVDTGTGTILAGDVITFNGHSDQYVVKTGFAGDGDGDIVLQEPGLRVAVANDVAITITNSYAANMAFTPDAIELALRAPAAPKEGDSAKDVTMVQDPVSGIVFEVRLYGGVRTAIYLIAAAWGVHAPNPRHLQILKG
jgi:hypothetical protein